VYDLKRMPLKPHPPKILTLVVSGYVNDMGYCETITHPYGVHDVLWGYLGPSRCKNPLYPHVIPRDG